MILIFSHPAKMPIRAQSVSFFTKPDFKDLPEWDVFNHYFPDFRINRER
jgi:hypothetical protein